ncbi:MAG: ROK family protein [Clostridia bacterium]|nr:ROK family protein [Clostridia bacterium]
MLKVIPDLDLGFAPMSVIFRDYQADLAARKSNHLAISIQRDNGQVSRFEMDIYPEGEGHDEQTLALVERIVKSLIWIKGGWRIIIGGSRMVYDHIKKTYSKGGERQFDSDFMTDVYEREFTVEYAESVCDVPATSETSKPIGRHLDGCRIGFDAGGSDRKVSAVIDGEVVYSEEVIWHPKTQSDPRYHYDGILESMKTAASHLPRVDAIGISSAGIYIDNRIMNASLFIKVSRDDFARRVKNMYIDVCREIGDVPMEVANDGDVTALAGAMDIEDGNVLGIAMGTSEAGGYVDASGNITGWLNELAFVPVDAQKGAPVDDWSFDHGCGSRYFSQEAVIRLAPKAGIELDVNLTPAEKLKAVQALDVDTDARARAIYQTIGVYFGYAIAYYAMFYDIRHVLIMGRVTSGKGGEIIISEARKVIDAEFPNLKHINLMIPDEKSRRVGQSVAAASLPALNG